MKDKEYGNMSMYKQSLGHIDNNKKRPLTFYEKNIKKKTENKTENKTEKEPKSAIWWMIMIFCLVYGFEFFYNALIAAQ